MSMIARMMPVTSPWLEADKQTKSFIDDQILTNDRNTILFGSKNTGKTCLLFQAAVTSASEKQSVMFISAQPLVRLPLNVHGLCTPSAEYLQAVKFVYYSTVKELIEFCASVHTKQYYPDVIILDNLDYYLAQLKNEGVDHGMAKLSALLIDAQTFIATHSESKGCRMLLSCSDKYKSLPGISHQFDFNTATLQESGTQYDLIIKTKDNKEFISSYTIGDSEIRLSHVTLHLPT